MLRLFLFVLMFLGVSVSLSQEKGIASYYADKYNGKMTANGETFDMNSMTAAHPFLPFNTKVRVKNIKNNEFVVVRINDRGPFITGRIIDLSLEAAKRLHMIGSGIVPVEVTIIN